VTGVQTCALPIFVRTHPRIRKDLLFGRFFYTPLTALFDLGVLGSLLALFTSRFLMLSFLMLSWIPFLVAKYREGGHHLSFPMRVVRLAGGFIRHCVVFAILLSGSVYFGSAVL